MNKILLVAGIIFCCALLLGALFFLGSLGNFAHLLGETSQTLVGDDTDKFIGIWEGEESSSVEYNITAIWTFYQNDVLEITTMYSDDSGDPISTIRYNYEVNNNELCIIVQYGDNDDLPSCMMYEFSNDGNRLTLFNEGLVQVFVKLQ
jgi:hypothetical protein